jgi:pimeloyl-ACP methyl ester carboxylesterase
VAGNYRSQRDEQTALISYEAVLASWPVPHESRLIPTRHGETFVITCGDPAAPPLVLLHGAGSNSATWAGYMPSYAARFHVFCADLPGEAGKSSPERPDWRGPAFAEWVEDVLDACGIAKARLMGVSQGGWTALKFAVAHPERVDRMVLVSPGGIVRDRFSFAFRALLLARLGDWGRRRLAASLMGRESLSRAAADSPPVIRGFRHRVGALPIFTDEELRRLACPVQLIAGGRDPLRDTEAIAARLQRLLPALEIEVVPVAGHIVLPAGRLAFPFLASR